MAKQYSTRVRNACANAIESTIGASAILKLRSGAAPANCAAADTGVVLATINLPPDWMSDAVNGGKSLLGTWQDPAADATGTVAHYRVYDSTGAVCDEQGSVTPTGGGGDMTMDNVNLVAGQQVNVVTFTDTVGGA